ncbi:MAG: hypothetical protein JSW28_08760 [Thermoplasmata archaeon]|nr:MAG: hypothetical protein JSW28_08760 [Thermoplasmata archaeon]
MEYGEYVLGLVNVYQGLGTRFALFFTSERVIVAKTGNYLNLLWGGVLGDALMNMRDADKKRGQVPEQILSANKKNYAIPYAAVLRFLVKKPTAFRTGKITIATPRGEYKFTIYNRGLIGLHDGELKFEKLFPFLQQRMQIWGG